MEMKQDYYLRISDKATNEILFRKGFKNVSFEKAKYQAEEYLINDTALTGNCYPNIEVCLTTISSRKIIKNIMNWKYGRNGNVSLNGWDNYLNGKENKINKSFTLKSARGARGFFIVIFAVSFFVVLGSFVSSSDNFNSIKSLFSTLNFLLLLIYTGIVSILRDEFNYIAETTKEIKRNNFKLELPSLLAAITTIISFTTEEISNQVPIYIVLPVVLLVAFLGIGIKLMFDNSYDIGKFYYNKRKRLYIEEVESQI